MLVTFLRPARVMSDEVDRGPVWIQVYWTKGKAMVRRGFGLAVIAAVVAVGGVVSAQQSARDATGTDPFASVPRGHRANVVLWVLRKHVDSVDFQDATFEEILDWVRDQGPINVVPQWRALEAEGVGRDALVNLQLQDTIVADVLNAAMDQVTEVRSLRYRGTGNTLKISTESDFNRKLEVRVYDVADILVRIPNFTEAPQIEIEQQGGGGGGGGGGSQQQLFAGTGGQEEDDDEETDLGEEDPSLTLLRELIEDTVAPETWQQYGGDGIIKGFNRSLVVRTSVEVHEMIAGVFVR